MSLQMALKKLSLLMGKLSHPFQPLEFVGDMTHPTVDTLPYGIGITDVVVAIKPHSKEELLHIASGVLCTASFISSYITLVLN